MRGRLEIEREEENIRDSKDSESQTQRGGKIAKELRKK